MSERYKLPVAIFMVFIKDDKILLMRRRNTGWSDGNFDLPSGHIDGREPLMAAACREALEELGVKVESSDLVFIHLTHGFYEDGKEYIEVGFKVNTWQNEPSVMEPDKCDQIDWFALDQLPSNMSPATMAFVDAYRNNQAYSEYGFEKIAK